jgi:hypothetical protein
MMKSWKSRLLLVFTMLAVVLVLSLPATADDVDLKVQCETDHGYCKKHVSQEVWHEDTGSEPQKDGLETPIDQSLETPIDQSLETPIDQSLANPLDQRSIEAPVDEGAEKAPVDEISDKECSKRSWPPCGYYWPWPS